MAKPVIIAKITAAEGKRDQVIAAFQPMLEHVRQAEGGTEVYVLHTDDKHADVVWFYELYRDGDAVATHSGSDVMAAVGKQLGGLLAGRPEISRLTPLAGKGLEL